MTEKEKFAQDLAKATAHWLAYRRLSGFESLFSEALLMMPVAEFLLGHGYNVAAEQDTMKLGFDFGAPGEANYDIAASKDGASKLLLEMKYLKKSEDQRIIKDFVKLALPSQESGYERLFLLGYHTEQRRSSIAPQSAGHSETVKSTLIEKIRSAGESRFNVSSNADVILHLDGEAKPQSLSGGDKNSVQKWVKDWLKMEDQSLAFRVRCFPAQTEDTQTVFVLSVHRE